MCHTGFVSLLPDPQFFSVESHTKDGLGQKQAI